jgi:hypothetical protein
MTDVRRLRRHLAAKGYDVEQGGKHLRVLRPNGTLIYTMSSSPSDGRFLMNVKTGLRRAGVPVEGL